MPLILHKFRNYVVAPNTQILILGTFNPDIPNGPTFFYGRPRNYLWRLLPGCFGLPSLKACLLPAKQDFMIAYRIDFADLIYAVNVPAGQQANFLDTYLDSRIVTLKNITTLIHSLTNLKAVYFTRRTFGGIPNIRTAVIGISNYCNQKGIRFCLLETPARFVNDAKQQQWMNTIINQNDCLQP